MPLRETTYVVDPDNRIVSVSSGWDGFALENNGENVVESCVVGHKLHEFIIGDSTSMWIHSLVESARSRKKEIIRFYRCDSPEEKRYMRMTIFPEEDGSVSVTSRLIRTVQMKRRAAFEYSPVASHRKCSICNKISIQGSWVEPDDAKVLGLLDDSSPIAVVYSVCTVCVKKNFKNQSPD